MSYHNKNTVYKNGEEIRIVSGKFKNLYGYLLYIIKNNYAIIYIPKLSIITKMNTKFIIQSKNKIFKNINFKSVCNDIITQTGSIANEFKLFQKYHYFITTTKIYFSLKSNFNLKYINQEKKVLIIFNLLSQLINKLAKKSFHEI